MFSLFVLGISISCHLFLYSRCDENVSLKGAELKRDGNVPVVLCCIVDMHSIAARGLLNQNNENKWRSLMKSGIAGAD